MDYATLSTNGNYDASHLHTISHRMAANRMASTLMAEQLDSLQQAVQALTQLRETIAEAHGITKDLRAAIKEAKDIHAKLPDTVNAEMSLVVSAKLDEMGVAVTKAIEEASLAVYKRFDTIA